MIPRILLRVVVVVVVEEEEVVVGAVAAAEAECKLSIDFMYETRTSPLLFE